MYDNCDYFFIWLYSMWVVSNYFSLLITCFVNEQNKLCCIIIYFCELKLECINIVFVLKTIKGIHDNILIYWPSYSGVYQYEAKNESCAHFSINFFIFLNNNPITLSTLSKMQWGKFLKTTTLIEKRAAPFCLFLYLVPTQNKLCLCIALIFSLILVYTQVRRSIN